MSLYLWFLDFYKWGSKLHFLSISLPVLYITINAANSCVFIWLLGFKWLESNWRWYFCSTKFFFPFCYSIYNELMRHTYILIRKYRQWMTILSKKNAHNAPKRAHFCWRIFVFASFTIVMPNFSLGSQLMYMLETKAFVRISGEGRTLEPKWALVKEQKEILKDISGFYNQGFLNNGSWQHTFQFSGITYCSSLIFQYWVPGGLLQFFFYLLHQ